MTVGTESIAWHPASEKPECGPKGVDVLAWLPDEYGPPQFYPLWYTPGCDSQCSNSGICLEEQGQHCPDGFMNATDGGNIEPLAWAYVDAPEWTK